MIIWKAERRGDLYEAFTSSELNKFGGNFKTIEEAEKRAAELNTLERVREYAPRLLESLKKILILLDPTKGKSEGDQEPIDPEDISDLENEISAGFALVDEADGVKVGRCRR